MSDIPPPTILVPFSANPPVTDHSTTTSNTDPCIIHHSNNPSTILIYLLVITMVHGVVNKFGFVDGSLTSP
jgi:hypothetical protein